MRTKYYKGLWLSQFRTGKCIVDGVEYPKESLIWNIQGIDYTCEEMYDRMDQYWQFGDIATVTVHIKKIREKIEINTAKPQYIETIWGVGYRFKV